MEGSQLWEEMYNRVDGMLRRLGWLGGMEGGECLQTLQLYKQPCS